MKIHLVTPNSPYKTTMDIEQRVVIENPYIGPILVADGNLCASFFVRDFHFEGHLWRGDPHSDVLPSNALNFTLSEDGLYLLKER